MLQDDSQRTPSQTFTWGDDESASGAVVRAVAAYTGQQPISLEPLYESIDPDALDTVFEPNGQTASIEFSYAGFRVQVTASGDGKLFDER